VVPLSVATTIAFRAHRGQKRADGRDYIEHPLAVIEILMAASTHLPSHVYAAAVLHDVIEDTELTYADLVRSVGRPIATTVLGLSRPERFKGESSLAWEKRYLQQMSTVQSLEPSILLIKLADRIHNMENTVALSQDKRAELFHTTRTLYLPFFMDAWKDQPPELQLAYETLLSHLERLCRVPEDGVVNDKVLVAA
jgi:(p)ppGpp synthase/HD superfamily hydrolase